MFPNWTGWKTVKFVLGIVATSAGAVAAANQGTTVGNVANIISTVDGSLMMLVVLLSGTNVGPVVVKKPAA